METISMPKEVVERSARQRVPHRIPVILRELSVSGLIVKNSRIPAHIEDFSQTGMRISSTMRLMTYTSVLCELSVEGTPVDVQAIAQVRWVARRESGRYWIGLQYLL